MYNPQLQTHTPVVSHPATEALRRHSHSSKALTWRWLAPVSRSPLKEREGAHGSSSEVSGLPPTQYSLSTPHVPAPLWALGCWGDQNSLGALPWGSRSSRWNRLEFLPEGDKCFKEK